MANNLVPNSFQCPNFLIDRLDYYLTPAETKVLIKAVREILGWNDKIPMRKNAIGLSIFVKGKPKKDVLGCGLGLGAVREALENLDKYHILVKVGQPTQDGQTYWLQDDETEIDWAALQERRDKWDKVNRKRTQLATVKSLESRGITSDVRGNVGCNTSVTSDVTQGITSDVNKETHEIKEETQVTFDSLQSASPDELPQAFDAHQRTIDQANGGNSLDPITEIVKHLRWLCAGRNAKMPKGKELTNYTKCAKALLTEKINTDDWQGVCFAIDHWKEHTPQVDTWRRDNTKEPHFALDHIAAHYWRIKDRQELDFLDEVPTEPATPDPLKKWWEDEVLPLHQEWKHARPVSRDNGTLVLSVSAPGPRAHLAQHAAGLAGELGLAEVRIEEG